MKVVGPFLPWRVEKSSGARRPNHARTPGIANGPQRVTKPPHRVPQRQMTPPPGFDQSRALRVFSEPRDWLNGFDLLTFPIVLS